jgi:NAD(P)-dependent dehydrogenase (short-subunit alcohol dehydrogenase family)
MPDNGSVLVVGASRGIGFELARQARAAGRRTVATVRQPADGHRLAALGIAVEVLDVTDAGQCAGLAASLRAEAFAEAWLVAGVYGPRTQGLQPPSMADFDAVMRTNVFAAMQLLPVLEGLLAPGARVGVLSSRMGSIGLRDGSAGWLYRASKAALNSLVKDAALAWAQRATVAAFHPGWVQTDMGGAGADLNAATSAANLRATLAALPHSASGGFFNHDGQPLAW